MSSSAVHRDQHNNDVSKPSFRRAYSFAVVTAALFLLSWTGQFVAQLLVVRNENSQHEQPFAWGDFIAQFLASTFENWQSEFLQLIWQAAGLALFLFWGSSQSKESDERLEAKVDALLRERGIDAREISATVNRSLS
ncbi:MAG: hypothetical protein JNL54_14125 [Kineosporiaceae bacterium]|nr:hypothetical protein [Kineosporiaceae bacterium]